MSAVRWAIIAFVVLLVFPSIDYGIWLGSHSSSEVAIAGVVELFIFLYMAWHSS